MSSSLRCRVLRRYPMALVEVTGTLGLDTAVDLRGAVLKVLVDQPAALVLDLRGLRIVDEVAATVFLVLAQHAASWSSAALLVAAPTPATAAVLHRAGLHQHVQVYPSLPNALTAAAARPLPRRLRHDFAAEPHAPAHARALVGRACEGWELPVLRTRAVQVANELVSNAVEHARTPGVLLVARRARLLLVSVRDGCLEHPLPRRPGPGGGFGLALVAALSAGWGTRSVPDGKVVWATLRIWPEPSRREAARG